MQSRDPEVRCSMVRVEALEGDNDFIAQFTCTAGSRTEHFGLVGHEFISNGKVDVVVPLDTGSVVDDIIAFGAASGLADGIPRFIRSFAISMVNMLDDGKPLFDQTTFVVVDTKTAYALAFVTTPGPVPPVPYDGHVVLASKFSNAFDYSGADAGNDNASR
jgi:hypothetical protein